MNNFFYFYFICVGSLLLKFYPTDFNAFVCARLLSVQKYLAEEDLKLLRAELKKKEASSEGERNCGAIKKGEKV